MAYCYTCGRSGAYHRRDVVTGHSSSSRTNVTYTGPRFLCDECSLNMDRSALQDKIYNRYFIILILLVLIYFFKR